MSSAATLLKKVFQINQITVVILVALLLLVMIAVINESQSSVEAKTDKFIKELSQKPTVQEYELAKAKAEVDQIRSDISGSLFWLKLIGLLVTVGGAVGGYLIAQSKTTKKRLEFEHRKDVDNTYQSILQELSSEVLQIKAAAVVKLGSLLQSFPSEWDVKEDRKEQMKQLTKNILAATLSIESDEKILKLTTIALVLDKKTERDNANATKLDLSGAKASNAYWANTDFSSSDFFQADLSRASFRKSLLKYAQFKEANLKNTVFAKSNCNNANFEGAKVSGMNIQDADLTGVDRNVLVDASEHGDGSRMIKFSDWLAK